MENKKIEFCYKGERDYIHGTDMFNVMMAECQLSSTPNNIHFTIHDFIQTAICTLYLTESKIELNEIKDIAARCQVDIDGITHWLAIAKNSSNNAVAKRYAYNEDHIVSLCNMAGEYICLNQLSPYSFIETIVAMNKHMHQQLFPEVAGQWIFTRIDLPAFCGARENLALKFRHNMNYKLTKGDIEVNREKIGDIFFSLVNT